MLRFSLLTCLESRLTGREEPFLQSEELFLAHPVRIRLCPRSLLEIASAYTQILRLVKRRHRTF